MRFLRRLAVDIWVLSCDNSSVPEWTVNRCADRMETSATVFVHNSVIHCTFLDWSASGDRALWLSPMDNPLQVPESEWSEYALIQRFVALPQVLESQGGRCAGGWTQQGCHVVGFIG